MPELPEVQTIVNELIPKLQGKKIEKIRFLRNNILQKTKPEIRKALTGRKFKKIVRIGKYIIFVFDDDSVCSAHLRMTGKFIVVNSGQDLHVHDRLIFLLSDQSDLRFNDSRTLGKINLCPSLSELGTITGNIGIDPLSPEFPKFKLYEALQKRKSTIKSFLMEAKNIAGIGNIYASEILFRAGIRPEKLCNKISKKKAEHLRQITVNILKEALGKNGTTISDFKRVDSQTGEFQNFLNVYQRNNLPCRLCGQKIKRIVMQQRSTFYCITCQK